MSDETLVTAADENALAAPAEKAPARLAFEQLLEAVTAEDAKISFIMPDGIKVEVDIAKAFPLTIGDWMDLHEQGWMDHEGNIIAKGPATIGNMVAHFCRKVNKDITLAEVKTLGISKTTRAFLYISRFMNREDELNPTKETA